MKLSIVTISLLFLTIISSLHWKTRLDEAKKEATKNSTNILLVFSGSDWCKPCIQLKNTVFKSEEFANAVKSKYELVVIDFKRDNTGVSQEEISYREKLAEMYNPNGYFPLVVILDAEGNALKTIESYKGETAEYYINNYLK